MQASKINPSKQYAVKVPFEKGSFIARLNVVAVTTINRRTTEKASPHSYKSTVEGWLYNLRKSGKIVFPIVRDGSGLMQCVAVKSNLPEELFEALKGLTQESSLSRKRMNSRELHCV